MKINILRESKVADIKSKAVPRRIKLEKIYEDKDWKKFKNKPVVPLGMDTPTNILVGNLANNFSVAIVGKKGSGKSNFFHCAMVNLLRNSKTKDIRFILIDPKQTELSLYEKLPNLMFPIISNIDDIKEALMWCLEETERNMQLRIEGKKNKKKIPRTVIIIDELPDLMRSDAKFIKKAIENIVNYGYLAKINVLIGTSKPSLIDVCQKKEVDYFQYRIAFATASANDSKTIFGDKGAEKLKDKGDMLLKYPEREGVAHIQGFYVTKKEIKEAVKNTK